LLILIASLYLSCIIHVSLVILTVLMIFLLPCLVSGAYNIGLFHWRPTESAKKLAKQWKEMLLADDKIWDQNGFNDILHKQLGPSVDDESRLVFAFDGKLKMGILPASIFCSGHTYFVQVGFTQLTILNCLKYLVLIFYVLYLCFLSHN